MFSDEACARALQLRTADAAAKQAVAKYGQTAPVPPPASNIVDLCSSSDDQPAALPPEKKDVKKKPVPQLLAPAEERDVFS